MRSIVPKHRMSTQRDPIGVGINRNSYAGGNPLAGAWYCF